MRRGQPLYKGHYDNEYMYPIVQIHSKILYKGQSPLFRGSTNFPHSQETVSATEHCSIVCRQLEHNQNSTNKDISISSIIY